MARWTIIRVYEVPADNRIQATDRMLEALALGVEKDYHVKDVIREPAGRPGSGVKIRLEPPRGWLSILRDQLLGDRSRTSR